MANLRGVKCDICGKVEMEPAYGIGWKDWMGLVGVKLDGIENPSLCPSHTKQVMDFIDRLKQNEQKATLLRSV